MADKIAQLQDRVNEFMATNVGKELNMAIAENDVVINTSDATETAFQENLYQVLVPKSMHKLQGSYNLLKQFNEEETLRTYNRSYPYTFINDFCVVMQKMIQQYFGMLHVSNYDTDLEPVNPDYIQVPLCYSPSGQLMTAQGYQGSVLCPVWEDAIMDVNPAGHLSIRAKLKYQKQVDRFLAEVEGNLRKMSVVRGQSVTVSEVRGGMMANPINPAENKKIILSETAERIVGNLIIPSLADSSKSSILFTGDFGTGKTETAIRVGIAAQRLHGRTFFYLHNAELFSSLIPYLKHYQPALVFVEDVDQISAGDRDTQMNNLLNQLDGNELKNVNCTFLFTTNNHDKIHPAMRRPGRIDQVVHFDYCDIDMIAKIYEVITEDLKGANKVDYRLCAMKTPEKLQGAVIAEIARRAVKYAEKLHKGVLSTDVLLDAIASMEDHIKFMRKDQKKDTSMEAVLAQVLTSANKKAFPGFFDEYLNANSDAPYAALVDN